MDTKHTYIFSTAAYNDDGDVKSVQEVTCCVIIKYKKARNIH